MWPSAWSLFLLCFSMCEHPPRNSCSFPTHLHLWVSTISADCRSSHPRSVVYFRQNCPEIQWQGQGSTILSQGYPRPLLSFVDQNTSCTWVPLSGSRGASIRLSSSGNTCRAWSFGIQTRQPRCQSTESCDVRIVWKNTASRHLVFVLSCFPRCWPSIGRIFATPLRSMYLKCD